MWPFFIVSFHFLFSFSYICIEFVGVMWVLLESSWFNYFKFFSLCDQWFLFSEIVSLFFLLIWLFWCAHTPASSLFSYYTFQYRSLTSSAFIVCSSEHPASQAQGKNKARRFIVSSFKGLLQPKPLVLMGSNRTTLKMILFSKRWR